MHKGEVLLLKEEEASQEVKKYLRDVVSKLHVKGNVHLGPNKTLECAEAHVREHPEELDSLTKITDKVKFLHDVVKEFIDSCPICNMDFGDKNRIEGVLDKKSRSRSFLSMTNWKSRHFVLEKQMLTYYKPTDTKNQLGCVVTKNAFIAKVHPEDADGKKFAFVVNTTADNPNGEESFMLNADSESSRVKWMNYIFASSKSESWAVKANSVQKKTGLDISTALLAKKKQSDTGIEDTASMLLDTLSQGFRDKKFKNEEQQIERNLEIMAAERELRGRADTGGTYESGSIIEKKDIKYEKLKELLKQTKENHAASKLQSFIRRTMVARRRYLRMYFAQSVLLVQTCIRIWYAKRRVTTLKIEKAAMKVIGRQVCRYRAAVHEMHRLQTTGQIFLVETSSAAGLVSKSVASNIYVYTMSCYDDSHRFKGKDETNIKNGFGLKSTSLHKSRSLPYSHDPDWDDEENRAAPAFTMGTTSNHFFVITMMAYDTVLGSDSFIGQAIVSMNDPVPGYVYPQVDPKHPNRRLPKVKTVADALYNNEELSFNEYPLVKYVAPVETIEGVAVVVLNVAMQIRQVTGTICFKIKLQDPLKCMTATLIKETNAFISHFSSANQWKTRLFALVGEYMVYAKDRSDFGAEVKHSMKLSKAVEFKLNSYDKKHPQKLEIRLVFKENKIAKPEIWTIRWPDETPIKERKLLVRKLYRCMTQFEDAEATKIRQQFMGESKLVQNTLLNMLGSRKGESAGGSSPRQGSVFVSDSSGKSGLL